MTTSVISAVVVFGGIGLGVLLSRLLRSAVESCTPPDPVIVSIRVRSRRPDPVVAMLPLSRAERQVVLDTYRAAFVDAGVWPDIKLEAFMDLIHETMNTLKPVPVFFAQKRILLAFAHDHNLHWLKILIEQQESVRSLNPIPEDVA